MAHRKSATPESDFLLWLFRVQSGSPGVFYPGHTSALLEARRVMSNRVHGLRILVGEGAGAPQPPHAPLGAPRRRERDARRREAPGAAAHQERQREVRADAGRSHGGLVEEAAGSA